MNMKKIKIALAIIGIIIIAACGSSKKTLSSTPTSAPADGNSATPFFLTPKSSDGVYVPGEQELKLIQVRFKDVTLEKLKEGHAIYAEGACVGCHQPENIYQRGEAEWKDIIDDMAIRANITAEQKDAVYKYVLSIKAAQPK